MDAIAKGGANTVTRDSLATSLARSTWDVVKAPGQELYQLVKYAPHVKRGGKKKAGLMAPVDAKNNATVEDDSTESTTKASA